MNTASGKIPVTASLVRAAFTPLFGLPCWGAKRIYGSIIKLEFGPVTVPPQPSVISKMRAAADVGSDRRVKLTPPGGEWDLTLINAAWKITVGASSATDDSLQPIIEQTLNQINGHTLSAVDWVDDSQLLISFREGSYIQAGPSPIHPLDGDMWWLFHTGIDCLTVDGYGMCSHEPSV